MKKVNKMSLLLGLILGILITSVTVYAINVKSSNVTFIPEDENWEVTSVESALNDLNEMVNASGVIYLGSGTSFDIKNLLPDIDYTKLTVDNFIIGVSGTSGDGGSTGTKNMLERWDTYGTAWTSGNSIGKTYSDGVLTITNTALCISYGLCTSQHGGGVPGYITSFNVYTRTSAYLVLGEIKSIS